MMDIWARKEHGLRNNYGYWRQRSSANTRPNLGGHRTVPSWEKRFCAAIGLVPWRKLLETKKYMHIHPNVVNWNDAAAEEAFDNAKRRYWAEIYGLPCDIKLPDPDVYIDKIDWDAAAAADEIEPDEDDDDDLLFKSVSDSESDTGVIEDEPPSSMADFQTALCCNYGWDCIEDDDDSQRWRDSKEINKVFACDPETNGWGSWNVEEVWGTRGVTA